MAGDILAELRAKEDELEARVNVARREAASIREAALKSAREKKAAAFSELDSELKSFVEARTKEMNEEAAVIEEKGREEASRLRAVGERNFEKAVDEIVRLIRAQGGADK